MATYTYQQFRTVLRKLGFTCIRSERHETREKTLEDGSILSVRISHKQGSDIGPKLFHMMLKEEEFRRLLRS